VRAAYIVEHYVCISEVLVCGWEESRILNAISANVHETLNPRALAGMTFKVSAFKISVKLR